MPWASWYGFALVSPGKELMALAFKDVAGALGYTFTLRGLHPAGCPFAGSDGRPGQHVGRVDGHRAAGVNGASLTPAQIGRLCQHWAYTLGCTLPQIGIYASDNM
jgi:hypothetical protein